MTILMTSAMIIAPRRIACRVVWMLIVTVAVLAAGLSACSVTPRRDPPSYGNWRDAMGEEVDRVRFSHLVDWQPLDRDWVSLEFSDGRLFALEVREPCIADVREASSLRLDSAMKNTLHRSDRVRLDGYHCLIETIRALASHAGRNRYRGSASASRGD